MPAALLVNPRGFRLGSVPFGRAFGLVPPVFILSGGRVLNVSRSTMSASPSVFKSLSFSPGASLDRSIACNSTNCSRVPVRERSSGTGTRAFLVGRLGPPAAAVPSRVAGAYRDWLRTAESRGVRLGSSSGGSAVVRGRTRFSAGSRSRLRRRLRSFSVPPGPAVFLTLTMRRGSLEVPEFVAPRAIWKWFNRFLVSVRNSRSSSLPSLKYLAAIEFTKASRPHLHIVFFGIGWLAPVARLKKCWVSASKGDSKIVHVEKCDPLQGVRYILKYVSKFCAVDTSLPFSEFSRLARGDAALWFSGARLWSCSRGLVPSVRGLRFALALRGSPRWFFVSLDYLPAVPVSPWVVVGSCRGSAPGGVAGPPGGVLRGS